jgi:hypothetical protein
MSEPLLQADNLQKYFPVTSGLVFTRIGGYVQAVDARPQLRSYCCASNFPPQARCIWRAMISIN